MSAEQDRAEAIYMAKLSEQVRAGPSPERWRVLSHPRLRAHTAPEGLGISADLIWNFQTMLLRDREPSRRSATTR